MHPKAPLQLFSLEVMTQTWRIIVSYKFFSSQNLSSVIFSSKNLFYFRFIDWQSEPPSQQPKHTSTGARIGRRTSKSLHQQRIPSPSIQQLQTEVSFAHHCTECHQNRLQCRIPILMCTVICLVWNFRIFWCESWISYTFFSISKKLGFCNRGLSFYRFRMVSLI